MEELKTEQIESESKIEAKKLHRSKTRRFLFQYLYALSYGETSKDNFLASFYKDEYLEKIDWDYFKEVCKWIIEKESSLIFAINKFATKFNIEKMQVEHLIPMFIAIYEMLYYSEEMPYKISINEAVELSKIYCDDQNRKLVNWVLNSVAKNYKDVLAEIEQQKVEPRNIFFKVDKNII